MLRKLVFFVVSLFAFATVFATMGKITQFLTVQDIPKDIDIDKEPADWYVILEVALWDIFVVLLFIVQHSLMATAWWKNLIFNLGLSVIERAIYVAATAWTLQYMLSQWLVIPDYPLWVIDTSQSDPWWWLFTLIHVIAWIILYAACFTMDVSELLGLKQVYYYAYDLEPPVLYKSRGAQKLYQHMRHPGACCLLVILWVHPVMTLSRLILASLWTLYLMCSFDVTEGDYIFVCEQAARRQYKASSWEMVAEYQEEEIVLDDN